MVDPTPAPVPVTEHSYTIFKILYMLSQIIGILLIFLMGHWIKHHMGDFAWKDQPQKEFNWHPLLIICGPIVLHGQAILIYRGFRELHYLTLKIMHFVFVCIGLVLLAISLMTAFDSHNLAVPPIPNLYTLHSWIGISIVIIIIFQWIAGFITLLLNILSADKKEAFKPYHSFFGLLILIISIGNALMGLTQKALWAIPDYRERSESGIIVNCLGIIMVLYGCLIAYLLYLPKYKRQPLANDHH